MKTSENLKPQAIQGKPGFLSAHEAAQFLRIKLPTLYAMVERKEIPFYRIGKRKLLFRESELVENLSKSSLFDGNGGPK